MNSSQLPRKIQAGLTLLLEAGLYAQDLACNPWDFAVEIARLRAEGLNESDLRWLVCKGLVEHAHEITLPGDEGRTFSRVGKLTFTLRTCFILTVTGSRPTGKPLAGISIRIQEGNGRATPSGNGRLKACKPRWDWVRRELYVGDRLVKRISALAPNQELVLAVFEKSGWAKRIDDPLSPAGERRSRRRLQTAIIGLNRNQNDGLIRFHGDGSGWGVCWESVHAELSDAG